MKIFGGGIGKRNEEEYEGYDEMDVATAKTDSGAAAGSKVFTFNASTTLHLVVSRPKKYSDAGDIAELYKNKTTVILMFNNTNKDIANRLIDFLGGVSYITDGELKRIGDTTYVLAPYNVDISGDFIEEISNISGSDDIFDTLG
ncbi:MAG: cell division protein SepF [Ruminiclostridium sp.]|nr:cell division protein SepF [Ruminiclostridium sp.]